MYPTGHFQRRGGCPWSTLRQILALAPVSRRLLILLPCRAVPYSLQDDEGSVELHLDLGKGRVFSLSGVPGRGPFFVSTSHPFLQDGLFVENLEEIQSQAKRIEVTWTLKYYCVLLEIADRD